MSSRILVALRVPGSPERVFDAFTGEIGLWWRDNPLFGFTPRSPGVVAFEPPADGAPGRFVERLPGGKTFLIGEVTSWEAGRRLVFGWRQATFVAGQQTEVEVGFEPSATRPGSRSSIAAGTAFPRATSRGTACPSYCSTNGMANGGGRCFLR